VLLREWGVDARFGSGFRNTAPVINRARRVFGGVHGARNWISFAAYILTAGGLCIFQAAPMIAQEHVAQDQIAKEQQPEAHLAAASSQETGPAPAESKTKAKEKRQKRGAIVVAPLPISSPAVGSGVIPVAGYIFSFSKKDKISPPSVIGAAGLITNNGSRGFALGAQLYLKENRYRITSGYVHGNIDYNIYGFGATSNLKLPLVQTGHAFFGEFVRRIGWQFFAGPRFLSGNSTITLKPSMVTGVPIPPDIGLHTTLTAVGAALTRDTSSNRFYPTGGTFFNFTGDFFPRNWAANIPSNRIKPRSATMEARARNR